MSDCSTFSNSFICGISLNLGSTYFGNSLGTITFYGGIDDPIVLDCYFILSAKISRYLTLSFGIISFFLLSPKTYF